MSLQEEILAWHINNFECLPDAALRKSVVEMGELIQADFDLQAASNAGHGYPLPGAHQAVADELGDVLVCLYAYAGRVGIDLDTAVRNKFGEVSVRSPERIHRREV